MAHITDHVTGGDHTSFFQVKGVGKVLTQVGIVIVPFAVKAADADAPASVPVPADCLHIAGLHGDNRCTHLSYHVVPQMLSFIAVASSRSEIVIMAVFKAFCNGGIGFQSVYFFPGAASVLRPDLSFKFSHHAAQNRAVSFFIIRIIFVVLHQFFHGKPFFRREFFRNFCDIFLYVFLVGVKFPAVSGPEIGKQLHPVEMHILSIAFHIRAVGFTECRIAHIKIHPFDTAVTDCLCLPVLLSRILPARPYSRQCNQAQY